MTIRLRQLEAFRAVARSGSITRAAEMLDISQPAVSRLLASFSSSVGFELFTRQSGQLRPTDEARYLLTEVERALNSLDHVEDLTKKITARNVGHLRIACLPGFATCHLPRVLTNFLGEREGVTATLEPDRPERILEWIVGEQFDCGITDGFTNHPAVESQTILIRTCCILPVGHPLAGRSEITPRDLTTEKFIHTRRDSEFYRDLNVAFLSQGLEMNSWVEIRQFGAACNLVAQGEGVSVVSELDAMNHPGDDLVLKPFSPDLTHRLALVRPVQKPPTKITLEFMREFKDSLTPYVHREQQKR